MEKQRIDRRHNPIFATCDAKYFIGHQDGLPVGSISAPVHDTRKARGEIENCGLGFFKCDDDVPAAEVLVRAEAGSFGDRGICLMHGPCDLSIKPKSRLPVEGFDALPAIMIKCGHVWLGAPLAFRMLPNCASPAIERLATMARKSERIRYLHIVREAQLSAACGPGS